MTDKDKYTANDEKPEPDATQEPNEEPDVVAHTADDADELPWCVMNMDSS